MRKAILSFFAALFTIAALVTSPPAHASSITVLEIEPLDMNLAQVMPTELQGHFCKPPYVCQEVPYPASLFSQFQGVTALNTALANTSGQVVVFGYSEGAQVANDWITLYGMKPGAPSPANLSFFLIGNPQRQVGGYIVGTGQNGNSIYPALPANEPYQITDLARQFDGWGDWPASGNQDAIKEAICGMFFTHDHYQQVDINDHSIVKWTVQNITYEILPTPILPCIDFDIRAWDTPLAYALNSMWRPGVNAGYHRPVNIP